MDITTQTSTATGAITSAVAAGTIASTVDIATTAAAAALRQAEEGADLILRSRLEELLEGRPSPASLLRELAAIYHRRAARSEAAGALEIADEQKTWADDLALSAQFIEAGPALDPAVLQEPAPARAPTDGAMPPRLPRTNDPADAPHVDADGNVTYPSEEARARRSAAPRELTFRLSDLCQDGSPDAGETFEIYADGRPIIRILGPEEYWDTGDAGTVVESRTSLMARYIVASYKRCRPFPLEALENPQNRLIMLLLDLGNDEDVPAGTCSTCPACACEHAPDEPHNRDSEHYQAWFNSRHDRCPTWADAMAHCAPETRATWAAVLAGEGIAVDSRDLTAAVPAVSLAMPADTTVRGATA